MAKGYENWHYPMLLDGGLSNVLENRGFALDHPLWTAKILDSHPAAILAAHLAYLQAGAHIILTASYQASFWGFKKAGYHEKKSRELILLSVQLALEARAEFLLQNPEGIRPLIGASIGPYGAYLADGSEYKGNYGVGDGLLKEFHEERLSLLAGAGVDFLACETVPSFQEARVLSAMLAEQERPAWVSFSCRDEAHISDGTDISVCGDYFSKHPKVFAVGINCTAPKFVPQLLKKLIPSIGDKKAVVYPNSGEIYDPVSKSWSEMSTLTACEAQVQLWRSLGADIVGGCCRIGPEHIKIMGRGIRNK